MKKDVIYIDADDEIAAVVDKVVASKSKVVALVLPKRFTMLHSAVNMKILNKTAADNKKNLVLITNEQSLLPLAASAGVYVAKNLQSKPEIPSLAGIDDDILDTDEAVSEEDLALDSSKSIGELAGDADESITLDNTDLPANESEPKSEKKNKKLAVPNFEKFRSKLFLIIGGIILLVVFLICAIFVWPKATVIVTVQQQQVPLSIDITASPKSEDNISEKSFKLQSKTIDKADSKSADATGKLDKGEKATGTVQLTIPCSSISGAPPTIPAGTGVSTGNLTYITQKAVSLTNPSFSGGCKFGNSVDVTAQNAGGDYNISSGRTFTVAGYSAVTGTNSKGFAGGTSNVVTVVSQQDCSVLQDSLASASTSEDTKKQLLTEFEQAGLSASTDTYKVENISSSCEPSVGQEASTVTAKATYRYTMSGVSTESLNQLLTEQALAKAGQGQAVIDSGVSTAVLTVTSTSGSVLNMTVKTTAVVGVKQDEAAVKTAVAGKNTHEATDTLKKISGVAEVTVDYSPFWVNKIPKNQDKITVKFVASDGSN